LLEFGSVFIQKGIWMTLLTPAGGPENPLQYAVRGPGDLA